MQLIKKETVRSLRKDQTLCEKILWNKVRNRQINNKKFLRQHPIIFNYDNIKRFFVADLYCSELKLIIEIDGSIHDTQKDYDAFRENILIELGYKVVRFRNEDILNNIDKVIKELNNSL